MINHIIIKGKIKITISQQLSKYLCFNFILRKEKFVKHSTFKLVVV